MPHSLFFRLSEASQAIPVSRLRLGPDTAVLVGAGLTTLGLLLSRIEIAPRGIQDIPGLTAGAAMHLRRTLEALSTVVDDCGNIDWAGFDPQRGSVSSSAVVALPAQHETKLPPAGRGAQEGEVGAVPSKQVMDGYGFIESFPEVIDALIRSRRHDADRLIITERLARQPHERKTLEQVAAAASGSLTRERIRQRESKLLEQLAGALVYERPKRLGLTFRSSFTGYWRQAAERFGQKEEITFTDFIEGLQEAWSVPADRLFVHLPLIMSVLTRKATIPERMRAQMKLDPRVYRVLDDVVRKLPLTKLAIGKSFNEIMGYGIETIGELFDLIRMGRGPDPSTRAGRAIARLVAGLMDARAEDGSIDWPKYAQALELARLPEDDPTSAARFLEYLPCDMQMIVEASAMPARTAQIFKVRIAVPRAARLTLADAAELLGTHGPTIKRLESLLLIMLNDQLIDQNFTRSRVMFPPRFLGYWADAALVHRNCGTDFAAFCALLIERWGVSQQEISQSAEILWAVLNEYPGGRPARKTLSVKRARDKSEDRKPQGVILLRGFRRVH